MIAAILLAQWRGMRLFRTGANPAAIAISWISGLLFYGFWIAAAFGTQAFFASAADPGTLALALSGALAFMLLYWQITPVITASMGASLDLKKLLVYPIPHGKLFAVDILLRLTTCAEMLLVLCGIVIGLARNPAVGALPRLLAVATLWIAFNILLSAGVRGFLERLLLRKRMKEVLIFLLLAVSILPQVLLLKGFRFKNFNTGLFPEAPYLPWSAASHLLLGSQILVPLIALAGATLAAYLLTRWQFERNLRVDGAVSTRRNATVVSSGRWELLFRWPALLFSDPTAAIMEKELRSLLRTPQFRFIFIMGAAFGLLISVPQILGNRSEPNTFFYRNLIAIAAVYAVLLVGQVTYLNCFGYERSAAQAWFSYPVPLLRTLVAKNLAALTFILAEIVLVSLFAALLRLHVTPAKIAESLLVALTAALYLMAFGNIASVRAARPLNPDKMSQGGSAKAMNAIMFVSMPVILLPIGLAFWGRSVFQSDWIFFLLLAFAAALGAALYTIGLHSAAATGNSRRERILRDLSKGEGPVSLT